QLSRWSHATISYIARNISRHRPPPPMNSPWRHCRRILLTPDETKLPDVALFGRHNYTHAAPALPLHAHKQCMEFCFLLRGRQAYRVGDVTYRLTGGDIFVTFPDEPHDTAESPEEK